MQFGNSAGISFSGLSSGIDTDNIVRQLVNLERQSSTRLETQQLRLRARKDAYSQFKSQLQSLNTTASGFGLSTAFQGTKGASSNADVATITANSGATPSVTELTVYKLAQAEKIASKEINNTGAVMNIAGKFKINGKELTLDGTETLSAISKKINDSGAGVSSSVISSSTGKSYLSLTSSTTGIAGKITLSNVDGGRVLDNLGLTKDIIGYNTPTISSSLVANSTTAVSTQFGQPAGSFSFDVNGHTVSVDASDNLDDIAAAINATGKLSANIVSVVDGGTTKFKLDISSSNGDPVTSFSDPDGFLERAGYTKSPTTLVQAQDSEFALDGVRLTRSSNSISDALEGATINLLQAANDGTKKSNLSVVKDSGKGLETAKGFAASYNRIVEFVRGNSRFDSTTFQSGVLFGDSVSQGIESSLNTILFNNVDSVSGQYKNLTQVGFSLSADGKLEVDETAFKAAMENDPDAVAALFRANGTSANPDVKFVSAGNKVKPSGLIGYDINITKAATKSTVTGETAGGVNRGGEILTFNGTALGSSGYQLSIGAGKSMTDVVDMINTDSKLKGVMEASVVSGKLVITSKTYGAASALSVTSNYAGAADTSGVGTGGVQTRVIGEDVAGTINGEVATGYGRFLTGSFATGKAEGLQIEYTGTATGNIVKMAVSMGMAGALTSANESYLNSTSGLLVSSDTSLDDQIKALDEQIGRINDRATAKEASLRRRFAAMEAAIAQAQAQGQRASASLNANNSG